MKKFIITSWLMIIVSLSLFVYQGFCIWYFEQGDKTINTNVEISADILNHNTEDINITTTDATKKYDVYFMAQNIDINKFIRYSNAINACEFKPGLGFKDLYYTNEGQGVTGYTPKLGSWDPTFTGFSNDDTDAEREQKLFKKLTDRYYLTEQDVLDLAEPYVRMCDSHSTNNKIYKLDFLDWTLDNIYITYPEVYETDNKYNYYTFVGDPPEKVMLLDKIENETIYTRSSSFTSEVGAWNEDGYYRVYGTYPTEGFNIANLNNLLEIYDNYSIQINGRNCLFFYPIYSLGKDNLKSQRLVRNGGSEFKNANMLNDCIRSEDSGDMFTDEYVAFDCEYTNLLQNYKDASNNYVLRDSINYWTIDSGVYQGQLQGWEKLSTRFKCYKFSNRRVTNEMVTKNLNAYNNANRATTYDDWQEFYRNKVSNVNRDVQQDCYPLQPWQVEQLFNGQYIFNDVAQNRRSYDGYQFSYLQESNGDLLNINYKTGIFNIYIFVKEVFIDGKLGNTEDLSQDRYVIGRFPFLPQEINGIDSIIKSKNINVDKSVDCMLYEGLLEKGGGWGRQDGRDYYVVFEEKVTPENVSSYGSQPTEQERNFDYAMQSGYLSGNAFVSSAIDFDIDNVTSTISTTNALTINEVPITLTYPSYYFTNTIRGEENIIYKQTIGHSAGSTYVTPKYRYIFSNGTSITKEYQSTQLLETMYTAVMDNPEEKTRISVTLADNQTYTLAQLEVAEGLTEVYNSIIQQLENVQLIRVKYSGSYRICIFGYRDNEGLICFDVWASSPMGYVVTIYDREDFSNNDIVKDIDSIFVSRNWMTDNYSFIGNTSYYDNADLLYGNNIEAQICTEFKFKADKVVPNELQPFITTSGTEKFVSLSNLLQYYNSNNKCLLDISTGRYITYSNIQTSPFTINKDYLLVVVNKPANMP